MGNGNKSSTPGKKKVGKGTSVPEVSSGVKDILETSLENEETKGRQGGDGESLPNTPPNEPVSLQEAPKDKYNSPFLVHLRVDVLAIVLFISSLVTRLYRLDQPKNVV